MVRAVPTATAATTTTTMTATLGVRRHRCGDECQRSKRGDACNLQALLHVVVK